MRLIPFSVLCSEKQRFRFLGAWFGMKFAAAALPSGLQEISICPQER